MIFENPKYYNKIPPAAANQLEGVKATVDGVDLHIPADPANRHYAEILRQVAAGTLTIEEAD